MSDIDQSQEILPGRFDPQLLVRAAFKHCDDALETPPIMDTEWTDLEGFVSTLFTFTSAADNLESVLDDHEMLSDDEFKQGSKLVRERVEAHITAFIDTFRQCARAREGER
eukprot:6663169-Prymnesium_polylepis.1